MKLNNIFFRKLWIAIYVLVSVKTLGQRGIGTNAPDGSSVLELKSIKKGFLPPRMTKNQMDAIVNPAEGLLVYCSDCKPKGIYVHTGENFISTITGKKSLPDLIVTVLNCGNSTHEGVLKENTTTSNATSTVTYTGGNGGVFSDISVNSTGITGLTATAISGTGALGDGTIVFQINGIPSGVGTATFTISFGGKTCSFDREVVALGKDTTTQIVDVVSTTGKTWMDRNLGATRAATSSTDAQSYGDLYQWGRKKDGHEKRTSLTMNGPIASGVTSDKFIVVNSNTVYNWLTVQDDTLWQSEKNDPCPQGYRVPTETELHNERLQFSSGSPAGAYAHPLKFTVGGNRYSSGVFNGVGQYAAYWTSTVAFNQAKRLEISLLNGASMKISSRAYGSSVRCIKK